MNTKADSPLKTAVSWSQWCEATPKERSNFSLVQTTNFLKEIPNGTLIGVPRTGLTTQFRPLPEGGYGDVPPNLPNNYLWSQTQQTAGQRPSMDIGQVIPVDRHIEKYLGVSLQKKEDYPDNNPKTAFGAKKLPLELVPPSAVAALAEAFADGAKKYGPYNWREKTISSSVYYGACLRHIQAWWDGEDLAEDSGLPHLHHALACLAMLIDGKSVDKLNDNRPPKGAASKMQKAWLEARKDVPDNVPKLNAHFPQ